MNCPKCGYPETGKYKGIYTPDRTCAGCGFVESNTKILEAYDALRKNIDGRYQLELHLHQVIKNIHKLNKNDSVKEQSPDATQFEKILTFCRQ